MASRQFSERGLKTTKTARSVNRDRFPPVALPEALQLQHSVGNRAMSDALRPSIPGHGGQLPSGFRSFAESRFHRELGDVRIHHGGAAVAAARALGARAFTIGRSIVLGQERATESSSRRLLAHELTHVIQQQHEPTDSIPRTSLESAERTANEVMMSFDGATPLPAIAPVGGVTLQRLPAVDAGTPAAPATPVQPKLSEAPTKLETSRLDPISFPGRDEAALDREIGRASCRERV